MYVPDWVVGFNNALHFATKDTEVCVKKESVPKVWAIPRTRKNSLCLCKSGKKYKDCHGQEGGPLDINFMLTDLGLSGVPTTDRREQGKAHFEIKYKLRR
jgi:hypothetical protein